MKFKELSQFALHSCLAQTLHLPIETVAKLTDKNTPFIPQEDTVGELTVSDEQIALVKKAAEEKLPLPEMARIIGKMLAELAKANNINLLPDLLLNGRVKLTDEEVQAELYKLPVLPDSINLFELEVYLCRIAQVIHSKMTLADAQALPMPYLPYQELAKNYTIDDPKMIKQLVEMAKTNSMEDLVAGIRTAQEYVLLRNGVILTEAMFEAEKKACLDRMTSKVKDQMTQYGAVHPSTQKAIEMLGLDPSSSMAQSMPPELAQILAALGNKADVKVLSVSSKDLAGLFGAKGSPAHHGLGDFAGPHEPDTRESEEGSFPA